MTALPPSHGASTSGPAFTQQNVARFAKCLSATAARVQEEISLSLDRPTPQRRKGQSKRKKQPASQPAQETIISVPAQPDPQPSPSDILLSPTTDPDMPTEEPLPGFTQVTSKRKHRSPASSDISSHEDASTSTRCPPPTSDATVLFRPTGGCSVTAVKQLQLSCFLEEHAPQNIKEIRINTRRNLIAVDVQSAVSLKSVASLSEICGIPVTAIIPSNHEEIVGILRDIDLGVPDADLARHIRCDSANVLSARRLGQTSGTVKVFFDKGPLPSHVFLGHVRVKVHKFQPRPIQCARCAGYGHYAVNCKKKIACAKCAGAHKLSECSADVVEKCANCNGPHAAFSGKCPKRQTEAAIAAHVKQHSTTRREARATVLREQNKATSRPPQSLSRLQRQPTAPRDEAQKPLPSHNQPSPMAPATSRTYADAVSKKMHLATATQTEPPSEAPASPKMIAEMITELFRDMQYGLASPPAFRQKIAAILPLLHEALAVLTDPPTTTEH